MAVKIIPATEDLIAEIEVWLDAEEAAYQVAHEAWVKGQWQDEKPPRGFRCNWDSVKSGWRERGNSLDVLVVDGQAVGFLNGTDILEIHPEHRGRGYGVLLADLMLKRAFDEGFSMIEIQIAPTEAEGFWVGQGFVPDHEDINYRDGLYAHRVLERPFPLGDGPRVPVEIEFYEERAAYDGKPPLRVFAGAGERLPDGAIQLPERVHGSDYSLRSSTENHIRIVVDGQEIYFGRAKYGQAHGAARDPHGHHYIDRITPA